MDLRQVVRYSAPTREAALARAEADLALARAAGFAVVGDPVWDDRRISPTLVVELRYAPPERLVRRVRAPHRTHNAVVWDAGRMALAGYRMTGYREAFGGFVVEYVFEPATMGIPVAPISPENRGRDSAWWPVRDALPILRVPRDDLARHIPPLRRAFLRLIGAPSSAIDRQRGP